MKGRLARRDLQKGGETVEDSQAPAVSEASTGVTPVAGGLLCRRFRLLCRILPGSFAPVGILFPGSSWRCCGRGCIDCGVWVQLCPSTSAAGAVALGAVTAIPAGAGDPPNAVPGVSGLQQRQVDSRSRRRRRRSSSGGPDGGRSSVTGGGLLHLCFLLVVG